MPPLGLAASLGHGCPRSATSSGSVPADSKVTRQDDLLAWWQFNESSGTTASDSSDSGLYPLTLTNMDGSSDWVAGKSAAFGNCLEFDGADDYAVSADENFKSLMGSNFTVSFWFYQDAAAYAGLFTIGNVANDGTPFMFLRRRGAANLSWYFYNGYRIVWTSGIDAGEWHHAAITHDGTTYRAYLDGSANGTYTAGTTVQNGERVFVGTSYSSNFMNGKIDDFRIYDVTLSAEEIGDVYGSGGGDFG